MLVTDEMVRAAIGSRAKDDEGEFPPLFDLIDFSGANKTWTVVRAALTAALAAAPRAPGAEEVEDLLYSLRDLATWETARADSFRDRFPDGSSIQTQARAHAESATKAATLIRSLLAERDALRVRAETAEAAIAKQTIIEDARVSRTDVLIARAEAAERERAEEWRARRDAEGSRDAAKAACDTAIAERDRLREALRTHASFLRDTLRDDAIRPTLDPGTYILASGRSGDFVDRALKALAAIEAEIGATTSGETGR